ncbi:PBP1A family penicillin-binding protein [Vallitalea pronyensis]|uniref:Penicillin-binding protein 1A n=1 Tax=Vallitalea pronyensis TaxID=1348613 RepID=A0A8J8MHM0_9FIRM|nr:PBP1A family penicillin-binding protein [Vallitalea pronyensis]QUI21977.1 PBP1A family penicillin-binding protein [Vallitalea pronyensis]
MNFSKESNKKKQKSLDSKKNKASKTVSTSFVKILAFAFLLFIIVGVCAGIGFVKSIIDAAPAISVDDIVPEGYASFVYDQNGNEIAKLYGTDANRIPKELDEIPKYLQDSFIVIEDERFWQHNGIDLKGIFRAIFTNLKEKRLSEGASTITQQLIKNNVLTNAETFERKIQEQYLAMEIEKKSSKEQILENYLNTVALGRGTNGVQSAANKYFNKDVSELTIAESAVLAAITQRPTYYDPVINPENNKVRQSIILQKLLDYENITQAEYDAATKEDVYNNIQIVKNNMPSSSTQSYYVDEVYKRVKEDLMIQKGITEAQAENQIYRGGLSIYINQDLEMQKILDEAYTNEDNFPKKNEDYGIRLHYSLSVKKAEGTKHYYKEKEFETDQELDAFIEQYKKDMIGPNDEVVGENKTLIPQPQSAMVIMDQYSGEVKAMVGGRGKKEGNLILNRATDSPRQPGSTFKVLAAYLPAIDTAGYTLATVLDDVPTKFPGQNKIWPKNYYKQFKGLSTVREGIVHSMNIITVKTLHDIGPQTGYDYLIKLGFTTLADREENNGQIYSDKVLPLALGGITHGVTVLELTAAYAAIANNGEYIEPTFYTKVLNHDNKIILEKQPARRQVMKETTAFLLTDALVDAVVRGTGRKVNFKTQPIAGKTGTTSDDKDILFAGYTPYYTAVVWQGFDYAKTLDSYAGYHKTMWRYVMERVHKDLPRKEFTRPSGIVTETICTESGLKAVEGLCDLDPRKGTVRTEYFAKGTVPKEECTTHYKVTMCKVSGLPASEYCPEEDKVDQVFIQRDPAVVIWDPNNPPDIADLGYEMKPTMIGEICHIHGPVIEPPINPLPQDLIDDGNEGNTPPDNTDPQPFNPLEPNDPVSVNEPENDDDEEDD